MSSERFPKSQRMVSQKLIGELFSPGSHSMVAFPLRLIYIIKERARDAEPFQLLISVPKKRFKHAVDRNRVKRQLREAFRHNSQLLADALPANRQLLMAFVWLSADHCPSAVVEARVVSLLRKTAGKL